MGRFSPIRTTLLGAIVIGSLVMAPAAVGARVAPSSPHATPAAKPVRVVRPDAQIAKGLTGALVGDGIYNTTGVDQARTGKATTGKRVTFRIVLQNDGNVPGHLRVQADGSGDGYTVTYLSGTTDVTSSVVAGTFFTGILGNAATEELIARVSVTSAAAVGSSLTRLVTVTPQTSHTFTDAVAFTAKRK